MTEEPSTRDVLGALLYLAGAILILCAIAPFQAGLFLAGCGALIVAYFIAIHKFAAMGGALFVMAVRFLCVFIIGKDPRMLLGGLLSAAGIFLIFKLDPESSMPLSYRKDSLDRHGGKK